MGIRQTGEWFPVVECDGKRYVQVVTDTPITWTQDGTTLRSDPPVSVKVNTGSAWQEQVAHSFAEAVEFGWFVPLGELF